MENANVARHQSQDTITTSHKQNKWPVKAEKPSSFESQTQKLDKQEFIDDKCKQESDQFDSEAERLAEKKEEEAVDRQRETKDEVPVHKEEVKTTVGRPIDKQLQDEVASFDRKVESLDKFKLELYQ